MKLKRGHKMAKNEKKARAAVLSFLEDLENEGIATANENSIQETRAPYVTENRTPSAIEMTTKSDKISYRYAELDPDTCKPWKFANRLTVNEATCADLISSISLSGQKIPVVVRPKKEGVGYELICGARRRFACAFLNKPVKAVIVDLSDQEALIVMDVENREREDISSYERGLDYSTWIAHGLCKDKQEIAQLTGVKASLLSQLLSIADLDKRLVNAFDSPYKISIKWGYLLKRILDKNPDQLESAIELAKSGKDSRQVCAGIESRNRGTAVIKSEEILENTKGQQIAIISTSRNGLKTIKLTKQLTNQEIERIFSVLIEMGF